MYIRVLILILLIMTFPFAANAAESANEFEIKVLPAEDQKSFSEGYFNLDSKPGQTLNLDFRIINNSKEPIKFVAEAVDAHTADKGGIIYSTNRNGDDDGRIFLSDLIGVQNTVIVAPGEAENVHFHLTIPASASGTLLGGIMLTAENSSADPSLEAVNEGGSNYSFERAGQRLVAVKLNLPEKSVSWFALGKAKFNADNNLLTLKVANGNSAVLENVEGTYTILDKKGDAVVSGVVKPFAMAPASEIQFPVDLKGQLLDKGKYVLMIKGRADDKEFFAEEKFSVAEMDQAAIVVETAETQPAFAREKISRTIAIALVVLFLLLPLFLKPNKRNDKDSFMTL